MQVLVDLLLLFAPAALATRLGGVAPTILGTAFVTLFYSSLLSLAKYFLDPFDNEGGGAKYGICVNVATLLQETNLGTERWRRNAEWTPRLERGR